MPVIYQEDDNASDEDLVRKNISNVLTSQVIHKVDEDTRLAREQKKKRQEQQAALESAQMMKRLEQEEKRRIEIERTNAEHELKLRGWDAYGWPATPHTKYYLLNNSKCCWGCSEEVAYLYERSPSLTTADSLLLPYSKKHKDEYGNYPDLHICEQLGQAQLQTIIRYLITANTALRIQMDKDRQLQSSSWNRLENQAALSSLR